MEYIIKHSPHMRGKEQKIYDTTGDLLLTISEKLNASSGKEVIRNNDGDIIYLIDSFEKNGTYQSTIYDEASNEILSVYLSKTYSDLNLHISSPSDEYSANHKSDLSVINVYQGKKIAATIESKKTLFGNNYILDINPRKDNAFIHLLATTITKLIEYNADSMLVQPAYAN